MLEQADVTVGQAHRFWQPQAVATAQHQVRRTLEIAKVAGADEQWLHPRAGAQHGADTLPIMRQRRTLAAFPARFIPVADQARLGAAHGGQAKQHAQVAGQAESSRMGDALAVAEQGIHRRAQPAERRQQRWGLPKGQQTWHIGKLQRAAEGAAFDHPAAFNVPSHDGGKHPVATKGAVQPSDRRHRLQRRQPNLGGQPQLNGARLRGRDPPLMPSRRGTTLVGRQLPNGPKLALVR